MGSNIENSRKEKRSESLHWWDRQHSLVLRQTPRWAQGFVLGLTILGVGTIYVGGLGRRIVNFAQNRDGETLDSGSPRSVEKRLPNHPEIETSLFLTWNPFFLALDQFRTNSDGLWCELRARDLGSIKVERRR